MERTSGSPEPAGQGSERIARVLGETLAYARERDYRGPDYGDGSDSRLLRAFPFDSKWLNILCQEGVKRAPVNVRPLLGVEYRRNPKGTALFAMTNHNLSKLAPRFPDQLGDEAVDYVAEARGLLDWLVERRSDGFEGYCIGYKHPIQHLDGRGVPNDPDVVSTSYAVKALLRAAALDPAYADAARTAPDFVVEDLQYRPVDGGAAIKYHLNHPDDYYTLNAVALGARLLVDVHERFGGDELLGRATNLLDYVAGHQTDLGGWNYRVPAEASHLSHDSHHNGFVIECFQRYREVTGSSRYDETLEEALRFYREELFEPDGAPNFDERSAYPRDVHASTQGALVFTYAGEFDLARRILEWAVEEFRAGPGRFYFRKHRFHTKRVTLMRWCQAWMAYAMSEYLRGVHAES